MKIFTVKLPYPPNKMTDHVPRGTNNQDTKADTSHSIIANITFLVTILSGVPNNGNRYQFTLKSQIS